MFCEPSYRTQSVNVTLTTPNMTISAVEPLGPPQQLSNTAFNPATFESIVVSTSTNQNGLVQFNTNQLKGDINETTQDINTTQLKIRGITDVLDNVIVFAVGYSQLATDSYLNASVLATSLDRAYSLLFALALNSVLSTGTSTSNPAPDAAEATISGDTNTIAVVRTLAIALEVYLGMAALSTSLLLLICWSRRMELRKDPASLSNVLDIIHNDPMVPTMIETLRQEKDGSSLTLKDGRLRVDNYNREQWLASTRSRRSSFGLGRVVNESLVLPYVMRYAIGLIFLGVLVAALVIVVALRLCIHHLNSLNIPSNNPILAQLILNYIPVLFATLLKPFWTLLNRKLCVLKPYEALKGGKAKASQSIDLRYTSLPPQLIIWRALKARHFLLVAVCAIGLSTNVLAVVLNALLQPRIAVLASEATFLESFSPSISQGPSETSSSDHLYISAANFSHGAPLPAWVTKNLYFLPFQINTTSPLGSVQSYMAVTPGFGLNVVCTNQTWSDPAYISLDTYNIGQPRFSVDQSNVQCTRQWDTFYDSHSKTNGSLEILAPLGPSFANASQTNRDICGSTLAMGFLRAELNPEVEGVNSLFTSYTWMTCESTLFTALYEVEVSNNGRVENHKRKSKISTDISLANNSSLPALLSNLFITFDAPFNNANPS